ncbi:MAG: Ig-like domain-containing protein [Cytophagaceae bacterium]|nr:Ig-like domain-containing protein [Gemmatimonadaceae bacterium]
MRLFLLALAATPTLLLAQAGPVARITLAPEVPILASGETLQLKAIAVDSSGQAVPGVTVRFQGGSVFEGAVDQNGLVTGGAPGVLHLTLTALVTGGRPIVRRVDVTVTPGPAATITIDPLPAKLLAGQDIQLRTRVLSRSNEPRLNDVITWSSSAPRVGRVSASGMLTGVGAGRTTISATTGQATQQLTIDVVSANIGSITIAPSTPQARTGDVVRFTASVKDAGGRVIDGLTPTWLMAPGNGQVDTDGAFVGYQPGSYTVTASFGQRSVTTTTTLVPRDVRRATATVGGLPIAAHTSAELWLHPKQPVAYLSTFDGIVYTIDIKDPAKPAIVDSIVADARLVNDVMTDEAGTILVHTRQGASDRRNGIAVYTLEDPFRPKLVGQFVDPVTSGVHSAYVHTQAKYGTFAYITSDFQGRIYIVDLNDPAKPKQASFWQVPRTDGGRYVHDMEVRDGLLYASALNDGLVVLDVGNGIKGGSPTNPVLVTQFKYDMASLRGAAAAAGRPVIGGTHTAWRHKNYVFVGDEILPQGPNRAGADVPDRAWGGLHVIDISDLTKPKEVAWYDLDVGGTHNFWVAGDTLYMGAFNAGFRAIDISGELRGDLKAQQREMAHVDPVFPNGKVPNSAFTWGVIVRDGLAYINDMNNGLTIVRLQPRPAVVP